MVFGIGFSLGRFLGGLVFEMAGSYTPALIDAAVLVLAVICINRLGPYAYPAYRHNELVPVAAAS